MSNALVRSAGVATGVKGGPGARSAQVVDLINDVRREHGLRPLRVEPALRRAATARARHLARVEDLTHDGWTNALRAAGIHTGREAAENIAVGYGTADRVVRAWLGSPGHRRNILDPALEYIGVAAAIDDDDDTWWCQLFAGGRR